MKPDRLQQIENLYNEALALRAEERAAFLEQSCTNDSALRFEVESLLRADRSETCLDGDALHFAAESTAGQQNGSLMGRMVGRYQLLSLVGRGGMGEVYCGVDTRLNRLVAIKLLPAHFTGNPIWVERLNVEARAVAALNHPHICTLHDIGHGEGMHYLVFEYLVGERLSERLARGALSVQDTVQYAIQMADALVAVHQEGIIHCDLKPHNIMLTKSGLKLLDFGIAELSDEPQTSSSPGTLAYMSPEQIDGGARDLRTDIFGFGVVTYQMLTAKPASSFKDNPPPVSHFVPQAPSALDPLLAKCLAKDPSERWQTMTDVLFRMREIGS